MPLANKKILNGLLRVKDLIVLILTIAGMFITLTIKDYLTPVKLANTTAEVKIAEIHDSVEKLESRMNEVYDIIRKFPQDFVGRNEAEARFKSICERFDSLTRLIEKRF